MRNRYLEDSVATASPGVLLVRLYDRLLRDLEQGSAAIEARDYPRANEQLIHAQDIVTELRATLRVDVWSGGPALAQIYDYAITELIRANVAKDAAAVDAVHTLFEPLRDAWREAASAPAAPVAATA